MKPDCRDESTLDCARKNATQEISLNSEEQRDDRDSRQSPERHDLPPANVEGGDEFRDPDRNGLVNARGSNDVSEQKFVPRQREYEDPDRKDARQCQWHDHTQERPKEGRSIDPCRFVDFLGNTEKE